jgi:hypothetical protein
VANLSQNNVRLVFLPLIEILTKIINHTNKETNLKAPPSGNLWWGVK